jgi:hypothetical protein
VISGVLVSIATLATMFYAGWTVAARELTQPLAGCTVCVAMPETKEGANTFPATTFRRYEAFNPGWGSLDSAVLNVMLREKFKSETEPPVGLHVEPVGKVKIRYAAGPDGASTQCVVTPWYYDKIDTFPAGACFGVQFVSFTPSWSPIEEGTDLSVSGHPGLVPAFRPITMPREATTLRHVALPAAVVIAASVFILFLAKYVKRTLPSQARKAVDARRNEIESQAIMAVVRDNARLEDLMKSLPDRLKEVIKQDKQQSNPPPRKGNVKRKVP